MLDGVVEDRQHGSAQPYGVAVGGHGVVLASIQDEADLMALGMVTGAVHEPLAQRDQLDRGKLGVGPGIGCDEQLVHHIGHPGGVRHDTVGVGHHRGVGAVRDQRPSQNLRPGAQQGQRGAQLMAGVGDERPLQGQGIGERADGSPGQEGSRECRENQTGRSDSQQDAREVGALAMLGSQVEDRLDGPISLPFGPHQVFGRTHVRRLRL